jgi:hypothetical protein
MHEIAMLSDYCGDGNPVIVETFTPGRGWVRAGWRKRVSRSWLRKLRREQGVTEVALDVGGRVADFRVSELLSSGGGR